MTEQLEGQETLPADFPDPVLTCDMIIEREIKDAISQFQYWRHFSESTSTKSITRRSAG